MTTRFKIKLCGALIFVAALSGRQLPAIDHVQFILYSVALLIVVSAWRLNRG